jgi:hypothetical protein
MPTNWLPKTPREYRFAPRVDGKSLALEPVEGQEAQAKLNTVGISGNEVLVWDTDNKRVKTTGVSWGDLDVLKEVSPGTADSGKAVVLSASKDVAGLRNLTATSRA